MRRAQGYAAVHHRQAARRPTARRGVPAGGPGLAGGGGAGAWGRGSGEAAKRGRGSDARRPPHPGVGSRTAASAYRYIGVQLWYITPPIMIFCRAPYLLSFFRLSACVVSRSPSASSVPSAVCGYRPPPRHTRAWVRPGAIPRYPRPPTDGRRRQTGQTDHTNPLTVIYRLW